MSKILFSILVEVFRAFVLIFFISACLLSSAVAGTIDLEAAKKLFENGNYEASLYELQKGDYRKSGEALELLARLHSTDEIGIDPKKIEEYLLLASEKDYVPAILGLGFLYEDGDILSAKPAEANKLYLKAFELGNTEAAYYLALNHQYGIGTDVNIEKAIQFYEIAIERGNEDAIIDLGILHVEAEYGAINYPRALELFSSLAERGIPDAEYNLALMFDQGLGVARNFDEAFKLYLSAHKQGLQSASYNLAYLIADELEFNGFDYSKVLPKLEQAAKYDHPMAMYMLGDMYQYGDGVQQDVNIAKDYLIKAAAFDDDYILELIADNLSDTKSSLFDPDLAEALYTQAFNNGNIRTACKIADTKNIFVQDLDDRTKFGLSASNIDADMKIAREWYSKARYSGDLSCSYQEIRSYLDTGELSQIRDRIAEILTQANQDQEQNSRLIFQLHSLLGEAFHIQGYRYEAHLVMQKALEMLDEIPHDSFVKQMVYRDYASTLVDLGECQDAIPYLERSLEIASETDSATSKALIHNIKAICYEQLNEVDLAIENYSLALEIINNHHDFAVDASMIYTNLSQLFSAKGNFEAALINASEAFNFQKKWGLEGPYTIRTLSELALIKARQGDESEALKTYELVVDLFIQRYFSALSTEIDTSHVAEYRDNLQVILEAANFYQELDGQASNRTFELLQLAYISSAQVEAARRSDRNSLPDEETTQLLKAYQLKLNEIPSLQIDILNSELREKVGSLSIEEKREKLRLLVTEKTALRNQIDTKIVNSAVSTLGEMISVETVQSALKENEALVFPAVTFADQPLTVFVITKSAVHYGRSKHTAEDMREKVRILRKSLTFTNSESLGSIPAFDTHLAYEIYNSLFHESDDFIRDKDNLLVVPTWPITDLPLGVLVNSKIDGEKTNYSNYPFLGLEKSITYLTAVSAIKNRDPTREKLRLSSFLGIGDPILGDKTANLRGIEFVELDPVNLTYNFSFENLPSLPSTRDELMAISNLYPREKVKLFLGSDAQERNLKSIDFKEFKIISFATHGLMAEEWTMLNEPALVLSRDQRNREDFSNGILTASEIRQLDLHSDLVILSACNTAAGDGESDEGLSGLASAFIFAGTKSVMASHWSVESTSTKELMLKFFEELDNGSSRNNAEALRIAMQSIFNEGYTHPIFWAPFILVE